MKESIRSTLGIIGIMILIIVLLEKSQNNNNQDSNNFFEEATPIREHSVITKMNYTITINKYTKKNSITCFTKIISSINHYKDIRSIELLPISLTINNKSYYHYQLKNIYIGNNGQYMQTIHYKNKRKDTYTFVINRDIIQKYREHYDVIVKFSK